MEPLMMSLFQGSKVKKISRLFVSHSRFIIILGNDVITSSAVEQAMRQVDRGDYCTYSPYQDTPQSIGYQATISAPHMV